MYYIENIYANIKICAMSYNLTHTHTHITAYASINNNIISLHSLYALILHVMMPRSHVFMSCRIARIVFVAINIIIIISQLVEHITYVCVYNTELVGKCVIIYNLFVYQFAYSNLKSTTAMAQQQNTRDGKNFALAHSHNKYKCIQK